MYLFKNRKRPTDMKDRLVVAKEEWGGVGATGSLESVGANYYLCNEVLLDSTGKYTRSLGIDRDGRQYKKGNVHTCQSVTSLCSRNQHNIVNQRHFNKKKKATKMGGRRLKM